MSDANDPYAVCSYCDWIGNESDLPPDPNHPIGKDECPECKTENFITSGYESRATAEKYLNDEE